MTHLRAVPDAALDPDDRNTLLTEYGDAYADLYIRSLNPPDPATPDTLRRWREDLHRRRRELERLQTLVSGRDPYGATTGPHPTGSPVGAPGSVPSRPEEAP